MGLGESGAGEEGALSHSKGRGDIFLEARSAGILGSVQTLRKSELERRKGKDNGGRRLRI